MRLTLPIYIACIVTYLYVNNAVAQSPQIDSLKTALSRTEDKQSIVDINNELAKMLYSINYEQGIKYAISALRLAEKEDYLLGRVKAHHSIGSYYYYVGDLKLANDYYQRSVALSKSEKFIDYPARTYLRLSILNRTRSNFDSSRNYLNKAKEIIDRQNQPSLYASYLVSSGILANYQSNNKLAIKQLRASIALRTQLKNNLGAANSWRSLGVCYTDISNYDSAQICFEKAESLLTNIYNPRIRMKLFINKGEVCYAQGKINEAIEQYNLALDHLQANTYMRYYARLLYDLGELYSNQNNYNLGYDYLFKAVSEFEKIGDRQRLAKTYSTIGWNYIFQQNFPKAMEYGERSLKIVSELNDSSGISKSYNLIGFAALKMDNYDTAFKYLESAYNIRHQLGLKWGEAYTLYNLALVHVELKQYDEALNLLDKALEIAKNVNNQSAYIYINNELGLIHLQLKNYRSAETYLKMAQNTAKAVPLASELLTNYKNFIILYESKRDAKGSLQYYRMYLSLKDSIDNYTSSGRISNADALFQIQKKTGQLQTKIGENQLQKEKIGEQSELIQSQRKRLIIISVSLIILIILLSIIVRLLLLRGIAKEKLRKQNLDIQEQQEEILTQSEELMEANQHLANLNETLVDKNSEIEAQSDQLSEINNNLEKQVADRTNELTQAYKELETFFYKASHDFRRPLTTYLGLVEVAKSTLTDKASLDLFEKVKLTTLSLDNMIFKLRSISDIDYTSGTTRFNLSQIVTGFIHKNKALIDHKNIQIRLPVNSIELEQNFTLVQIVITSLLENAIQFNRPQGPRVDIGWEREGSNVKISIEDNGAGINEEIQHKIFEMFYRGNELSQGNGMGLYVTKRAVMKLDGKITFQSSLNKGTTFEVIIPDRSK